MSVNPIPPGYHSVTPYLMVEDLEALVRFLTTTFGAEIAQSISNPEGGLIHADIKIGNSIIMVGASDGTADLTYSMIHIYTGGVDAVYQRALQAGAASVMEPTDQPHGDRCAGVKDQQGNIWWVATRQTAAPETASNQPAADPEVN